MHNPLPTQFHRRQTTDHILMVRPDDFGYNEQTANNNAFMVDDPAHDAAETRQLALQEFDLMVGLLRSHGITVVVFEDNPDHTPDAVFPNNWVSTHEDGKIILYPMWAPNRRLERRQDVVQYLTGLYPHPQVVDYSFHEAEGRFLEGTGSMILDRVHQMAYANISPRTDAGLFHDFCAVVGVEPILFHARDEAGIDIYHTNVMMALGATFAVICLDAIPYPEERARVEQRLFDTGHEVIPISFAQVHQFAGNMLQVYNGSGEQFTVMSKRACDSLRQDQIDALRRHNELIVVPLDVIETYGGGSVRCMMAEVFLPPN